MRLSITSSDVQITPGNYNSVSVEIECEPAEVINQLNVKDITDGVDHDDLLEQIDIDTCVNHFGSDLIGKFTPDEILEQIPIEEFIRVIGPEGFKDYLRDIYIDAVLGKDL